MAKIVRCRYCEEGHQPNDKGEHWIVKSIIPASIKIVACKFAKQAVKEGDVP